MYLRRGVAIIYATAEDSATKLFNVLKDRYPTAMFRYDRDIVGKVWNCYDAVVFVMALGGVIRSICGLIRGKDVDPAVIALDPALRFVIPLLGAHWGSNELAAEISNALNATLVMTTMTELNQVTSVEELAHTLLCRIVNTKPIVKITKALLRGEKVCVQGVGDKIPNVRGSYVFGDDAECRYFVKVVNDPGEVTDDDNVVYLRPLRLYVGVGARSSSTKDDVKEAIIKALELINIDPTQGLSRVRAIASPRDVVEEVARELGVPFRRITWDEIKSFNDDCLTPPSSSLARLGIRGVAEVSALIAGGPSARLVLRKVRYAGRVTVAIAGD